MTVEDRMKVMDRIDEAISSRDWKSFDDQHTRDIVAYSPMNTEPTKGIAAHREAIQGIISAFSDFKISRDYTFGQDDWICAGFTMTGTHDRTLRGENGQDIPATNKQLNIQLVSTIRFDGDRIAEEHTFFDRLTMLTQLGISQ
jgi:ketosteroid isomerase-like protein